jgi:hypothetical protein
MRVWCVHFIEFKSAWLGENQGFHMFRGAKPLAAYGGLYQTRKRDFGFLVRPGNGCRQIDHPRPCTGVQVSVLFGDNDNAQHKTRLQRCRQPTKQKAIRCLEMGVAVHVGSPGISTATCAVNRIDRNCDGPVGRGGQECAGYVPE